MRLDRYLVEKGLASSRSKAVHLIKTGSVLVNGQVRLKQSYEIKPEDRVEVTSPFRYASRAGYKIESALKDLDLQGLEVLDVGCSVGGFSDLFLQRGAARVVGVDIALGGINPGLLQDSRFRFCGGVDARDAKALASCLGIERFDLVSVDVSNALLEEVLPQVAGFLKPGGLIVALFKPPYQADRRLDHQQDVEAVARKFESWLKTGYEVLRREISPLRGGSKNRGTMELVYLVRPKKC